MTEPERAGDSDSMITFAHVARLAAGPLVSMALACSAPSEEIGATIGEATTQAELDTGSSGDGDDAASVDGDSHSTAAMESESETSTDGDVACFDAWAEPAALVEAQGRPPIGIAGMRLSFVYTVGTVTLTDMAGSRFVEESDGPFSVDENAGSWVELRNAADETLYTRYVFQLVPESMEVGSPLGNVVTCPENGILNLDAFPNDPTATHLVFFQEALDGEIGGPTVELLRFALP